MHDPVRGIRAKYEDHVPLLTPQDQQDDALPLKNPRARTTVGIASVSIPQLSLFTHCPRLPCTLHWHLSLRSTPCCVPRFHPLPTSLHTDASVRFRSDLLLLLTA